ncbi:MAG: hypothetical protein JJU29_13580, partial [Verrucomicrobia bacterium]|nr:hypothetical protein [Verrucomicrobiota bacterium]
MRNPIRTSLRTALILFSLCHAGLTLQAATWHFPGAAVRDLPRMNRATLFNTWNPRELPAGTAPQTAGHYVIYRHEALTYYFGPFSEEAEAQTAERDLNALRQALIQQDEKFTTSRVDRVQTGLGDDLDLPEESAPADGDLGPDIPQGPEPPDLPPPTQDSGDTTPGGEMSPDPFPETDDVPPAELPGGEDMPPTGEETVPETDPPGETPEDPTAPASNGEAPDAGMDEPEIDGSPSETGEGAEGAEADAEPSTDEAETGAEGDKIDEAAPETAPEQEGEDETDQPLEENGTEPEETGQEESSPDDPGEDTAVAEGPEKENPAEEPGEPETPE